MEKKIKLDIVGLTSGQSQGSYTLILGEENGDRKLPIIIGSFEAQAIAIEIEKIVPFRPMTHDLFISFATEFDVKLLEVEIHNLIEGVFYAKIICEKDGIVKEIDARTSDAIAIAVRFKCPIFTYENIMKTAGILLQDETEETPERPTSHEEPTSKPEQSFHDSLSALSLKELEDLLREKESIEDFEKAALIRDEINRRKNS